jgi:PTH1 family peptidyl-tRNA hydrolase
MLLFVGLGNPGAKHAGNRHNIGFMVLRRSPGATVFRRGGAASRGSPSEGTIGGEKVLLLLPGTYMNESGRAVAEAQHFYKLALSDMVVFHDEIELPPPRCA